MTCPNFVKNNIYEKAIMLFIPMSSALQIFGRAIREVCCLIYVLWYLTPVIVAKIIRKSISGFCFYIFL